jgi:hypothetical protein
MTNCFPHWRMEAFVEKAWPVIFEKVLKPETERRWSYAGKFGHTTLRIYEMAGRLMVTFERNKGKQQVTYITNDKDVKGENFGLQGYDGNYWEHSSAIDDVTRFFEHFRGETQLKYNGKQGIG